MPQWTDEQRNDWQEMLSHAKISLDSNCPLWEDSITPYREINTKINRG